MKINKLLATALVVTSFACCCTEKAETADRITVSSGDTETVNSQTIDGLTYAGDGGAAYNSGTLNIFSSTFSNNSITGTWHYGGAIENFNGVVNISDSKFLNNISSWSSGAIDNYLYDSTASIINISGSLFEGNQANGEAIGEGGAIMNNYGTINISDSEFKSNYANYHGGAIHSYGTESSLAPLNISSSTFTSNSADKAGGAIFNEYGALTISDTEFTGNQSQWGGAIYDVYGITVITDSMFTSNEATDQGGAITINKDSDHVGSVSIYNSEFTSNTAVATGGAIANFGVLNLYDSTFTSNSSTSTDTDSNTGGGVLFLGDDSHTYISNTTFDKNTSGSYGGAIAMRTGPGGGTNNDAILDILNSTFTNNTAAEAGGAIYNTFYNSNTNEGYVTISGSTFTSNSAAKGGAVYNSEIADKADTYAKIYISDSIFTSNTASSGNGGAIFNGTYTTAVIADSVFTSNTTESGYGGAIMNDAYADLDISNTTFTSNSALYGGALFDRYGGTTTVTNTTFDSNNAVSDDGGKAAGGAIYIGTDTESTGIVNIYNSTFTSNTAELAAGAIGNFGVLNVYDSTFTSNSAVPSSGDNGGGAMYLGAQSHTLISGSTFDSNTSGSNGGAITTRSGDNADNGNAILDIIDSTFTNNTAGVYGGAIYNTFYNSNTNEGYVTVSGSTFTSNSAANGGAIYNSEIIDKGENYASIYVTDSTFTSNSASENGGAFYNGENATAVIENSSFYSNSTSGNGGAIYTASDLTINSTEGYQTVFSGNSASSGSAVYVDNTDATLTFNLSDGASVLLEDDIDGEIGYNVDITGDSTSTTFYLYNDINNADVTIGNTTLYTLDSSVYTYNFNSHTLTDNINMAVDVDLANEAMDRITASSYGSHSGTLTVSSMNTLSDTTKDSVAIYFAEAGLKDYVANGVSTVSTPIYNYTVTYDNRDDAGYFVFAKDSVNPSVIASSVQLN